MNRGDVFGKISRPGNKTLIIMKIEIELDTEARQSYVRKVFRESEGKAGEQEVI